MNFLSNPSIFALFGLINAIFALFFGSFVFFSNKKEILNKVFGLMNLAVLGWSIFYFLWLTTNNAESAIFYTRALMAGAVMIPIFYLHWILILLGLNIEQKRLILINYLLSPFFFFSAFSSLSVSGVRAALFFPYWPIPGVIFHIYIIYIYFGLVGYGIYLLIKNYRILKGYKKQQIIYVLIGTFVGFGGGLTNFLLWYNIPIPPYANFFVAFYSMILAYAVLRYQLMDISVVIRRGAVTFTALALLISISAPTVILIAHIVDYPINYFVFWSAVAIFSGCVLLFIPLKNLLERFFNKYFFASLYNKEQVLKNLIREIPKVLNLDELTDFVIKTTRKALQIGKISLWSIDAQDEDYIPLKKIGFKTVAKKEIVRNRIIAKYFLRYHEPIMYQEIDKLIDDPELITPERTFEKLKKTMEAQEIEIIIPLVLKKELVGIMFLGRKIDGASYSDQDIDVLKVIADQSAVALENANLYKETQKFGERMKKEVKKATAKLRRINKQLTKLDKAKSEFISIASHQLRTPITAIKGYTSMVLEGDYGKVNKTLTPAIERIFKSSERMNALVESLLNISRIESGKATYGFKKINFSEMVKNITKEFGSVVKKKGLELTCSCPKKMPMVNADEVKIREVVSNLIDNAIKYTDNGKVKIKLRVADEYKSDFLLFSVKDTGMGIAEEDLPNVFQKFRRGKKVALVHTEGLGLGMYFSQKVVEAHKGKIWVESPGPGKGSTFFVRLPILNQ